MQVALIDYGAGNLPSVERALRNLGAETRRAADAAGLAGGEAIVLPGVGHFGAMMRTLGERGLVQPVRAAIARGTPFLGICLGLQGLYAASDEDAGQSGFGVFPGRVQSLPATAKLPHMGWNQLRRLRPSALLRNVPDAAYFYFAHSFAALDPGQEAVAMCDHGVPFVAVLERGQTLAVQFHPEKSGPAGAQVLANFLAFAARPAPIASGPAEARESPR